MVAVSTRLVNKLEQTPAEPRDLRKPGLDSDLYELVTWSNNLSAGTDLDWVRVDAVCLARVSLWPSAGEPHPAEVLVSNAGQGDYAANR